MQFDKGYSQPYFVTSPTTMEVVFEDALILIHEKKISNLRELIPLLEKVAQSGKPLLDHRRGRRGRGAGDPGRQQAPRRAEHLRGQGPRLRRSPQGDAGRHRRPDRRHGDQRRPRAEAGEPRARRSSAGPSRSRSTRTARRSSRAPARRPTSSGGSISFAARSRRPRASTTRRSSRSGWPSSPAAWR